MRIFEKSVNVGSSLTRKRGEFAASARYASGFRYPLLGCYRGSENESLNCCNANVDEVARRHKFLGRQYLWLECSWKGTTL